MPLLKSNWLHGIHEGHLGGLQHYLDKPSWILFTEEVGHDPHDTSGKDFTQWTSKGYWPVVRINHGYGSTGTIPRKENYSQFAGRVGNYVAASGTDVKYWIIGNEPNLAGERPEGVKITPDDYVQCFRMCREEIKSLPGHAGDVVIPAPVAPWNVDTGHWMDYFVEVLKQLEGECDGIALHTYTHGHDPALIYSEARMDAPNQQYRYHFRAYMDFMEAIPKSMRALPVLITETDQNEPWLDQPNSWIQMAYKEIAWWNEQPQNQTIQALIVYRYPKYDRWHLQDKQHVLRDFEQAVRQPYKSPEPRNLSAPPIQSVEPTVIVDASGGANIRIGPGTSYKIVGAVVKGTALPVNGRNADSSWFQVKSEFGMGWVSSSIVKLHNPQNTFIPMVNVTIPLPQTPPVPTEDNFERCLRFVLRWEGGWADDPNDSGGATMKGITIGTYTRWREAHGQSEPTKNDLRNISDAEVQQIYREWYWIKSGAHLLSWPLCLAHFDLAVNGGTGRAMEALTAVGANFNKYMAWRIDWYTRLEDFVHFGRGWMRRCADLIREVG